VNQHLAVNLVPVAQEKQNKLENLMTLYLHDLSQYAQDLKVNEDGRFEYDGLELFFKREGLHPYFINLQTETVGFILLNSGKFVPADIDYCVNELFLLKGYRGKGIAAAAINELTKTYPGKYLVAQLANNKPAIDFWRSLYKRNNIEFEEKEETFDGLQCITQIFSVS